MATEEALTNKSYPAGQDLSSFQYCWVKLNSSGQLVLPAWSGDGIGILQNKPDAAGKAGAVATNGRSKFLAGGTVNPGDEMTSVALTGRGVSTTTDTKVLGVCVEAATVGTWGSVDLDARR